MYTPGKGRKVRCRGGGRLQVAVGFLFSRKKTTGKGTQEMREDVDGWQSFRCHLMDTRQNRNRNYTKLVDDCLDGRLHRALQFHPSTKGLESPAKGRKRARKGKQGGTI